MHLDVTMESSTSKSGELQICANFDETMGKDGNGSAGMALNDILWKAVFPVLCCMIIIVGVAGNSIVIYVIVMQANMRRLTNMMLLNLAASDICFLLTVPPYTAYSFIHPWEWTLGSGVCKLINCVNNYTVYITIYTLVLISAVRYLAIVHPRSTAKFRTQKNICKILIGIWVIMVLAAMPFSTLFGVCIADGRKWCELVAYTNAKTLYTMSCVFAYFFPLLIIGVLSTMTFRHIRRHRSIRQHTHSERAERNSRQAGRVVFSVVLSFAVLWLPLNIDLLIYYWGSIEFSEGIYVYALIARTLAYANSCVNPIIYNFTSHEFRQHFREVAQRIHARREAAAFPPTSEQDTVNQVHLVTGQCA